MDINTLLNLIIKGFIITDDMAPTRPPRKHAIKRYTLLPSMVNWYVKAAKKEADMESSNMPLKVLTKLMCMWR